MSDRKSSTTKSVGSDLPEPDSGAQGDDLSLPTAEPNDLLEYKVVHGTIVFAEGNVVAQGETVKLTAEVAAPGVAAGTLAALTPKVTS